MQGYYIGLHMQKTILTLLLVAGLAGAANAQRSIRQRSMGANGTTSFGVKAGVTYSDLVGTNSNDTESIYGFHAGVFTNITLAPHFSFQPELLYSQKGTSLPIATVVGEFTKRRFHYADIPLAFHFTAGGFFLEAGPQIGFLFLAQDTELGTTTTLNRDRFKTADIGYLAGLGFERKSGFGIGARYNGEFTNVYQGSTIGSVSLQQRAQNSAYQLYLSYSFSKGY